MKKLLGILSAVVFAAALIGCPHPTASGNADLASLSIQGATLSPAFSADVVSYTATVPNATASVVVTATADDGGASVAVNGGASPATVSLTAGVANAISVVVTAPNGTKRTYTVSVTREAPAGNADLASLAITGVPLAFSAGTLSYDVSVLNSTASIVVTATAAGAGSTVAINGGASPRTVSLTAGAVTDVTVVVTATDSTQKTYVVHVTRAAASQTNADLASLSLDAVALVETFSPDLLSYTTTPAVPHSTASVIVTATAADAGATVAINGGASPRTVALSDGANTVTVVVTAGNGTTLKTYTVAVNRNTVGTNSFLASLSVDGAQLLGTFSPATTAYDARAPYASSTITVTAVPAEATSTVTVDGGASPRVISLVAGDTYPVVIVVTAENGSTRSYQIDTERLLAPVPVPVLIVESVNGTTLDGSLLDVYDDNGYLFGAYDDLATTGGQATLNLSPDHSYTVVASRSGSSQSSRQDFYVSQAGTNAMTIVQQKLGMITRAATAPRIVAVELTSDYNVAGTQVSRGQSINTAGSAYLVVRVRSDSAVAPTAWSGFGLKADFDTVPTTFNGIAAWTLTESHPIVDPDYAYETEFVVDLSAGEYVAGAHELVLVAYDVANNRVETRIPVTLPYGGAAGASLAACGFVDLGVDIRAYPFSREYFGKPGSSKSLGLSQYDGNDVSYRVAVSFSLQNAVPTDVPIRGFDVLRSTSAAGTYVKVGSVQYGTLSTGDTGVHTYFDADSALVTDGVYYYRVQAYTDATHSLTSSSAYAKLYRPFSASLLGPANMSTVVTTSSNPTFAFTISNTSLWSAAQSDFFCFALVIKEKSGIIDYDNGGYAEFRYNFGTAGFEVYTGPGYTALPAGYIGYSAGTVSILPTMLGAMGLSLQSGVSYQWNIFGTIDGPGMPGSSDTMVPCWFEYAYPNGVSKSYADVPSRGEDTANGWFEFYVQ